MFSAKNCIHHSMRKSEPYSELMFYKYSLSKLLCPIFPKWTYVQMVACTSAFSLIPCYTSISFHKQSLMNAL